jgi:hypothetical protein
MTQVNNSREISGSLTNNIIVFGHVEIRFKVESNLPHTMEQKLKNVNLKTCHVN